LTIPEAAEMLGVSRGTAYEAARDGSLPTIKLGSRRIVVPRARLLAMLGEEPTPSENGNGRSGDERPLADISEAYGAPRRDRL
jgi:excisionase family DNA binding protein